MATGCLFHEDRFQFEYLIKEIKACRWIPRPYINRVAMAICSCRKKKRMLDENEVKRALVFLQEIVLMHNTQETSLPETLADFLCSSLNGICNESRKRLLCILFETKNKNFHNLAREAVSNIHNLGEKILKKKNINMIPPKILARLVMKKKKAMSVKKEICLPMYPRNMKLLHIEINGNFRQFGAKNKCFLELEESKNSDSIDNRIKQTFVRVLCRDMESLQDITNQLLPAARKVQEQVDNRRKMHLWFLANKANNKVTELQDCVDHKGILTDDFGKKVAASQRKKKKKCPIPPGGHCLHCLKSLKKNSDKACTYHPGFISLAGRWSCCHREAEENFPTQKEHEDGGCWVATHVWRINKKTDRKTHALHELNTCMQDQLFRKVVGCSSKMAMQLLGV